MSSKKTRRQQRKKNKHTNKKEMEQMNKKIHTPAKKQNAWDLPSKSSCHTGQELIFKTVEGISVYGGGKNRQGGWHKMNPLPQLAMGPSETLGSWSALDKTTVPEGWSCEQHLDVVEPPLMLSLDWPDFSIPNVSKYFWYAVIDDIREHGIKTVSTQCAGGHGRTGVQLAILAYLLGTEQERVAWPDAATLIDWVREQHCVHAVEAKSQQQYIADVCDIPVGENKIHAPTIPSYGGWSGKAQTTVTTAGTTDEDFDFPSTGRIIDQYGADYCPHCGHDPHSMIEYGELCTQCGKDPQDKPTKTKQPKAKKPSKDKIVKAEDCPACDFDVIIDDECTHCGFDILVEQSKAYSDCYDCGQPAYLRDTFSSIRCLHCHTIEENISSKHLKFDTKAKNARTAFSAKCIECNKFVPSHHLADTKPTVGMVCFKCSADPPKKEVKQ